MTDMANKGLNRVRVRAGDDPNIDSFASCYCNEPAIRGETAAMSIIIDYMEFSYNFSRIRVLNHDNPPIAQSKLRVVWGESNVGTIICRWDLVTIDIPLPDFVIRYRDDVLGIYGREDNMRYPIHLLYGTKTFPCLDVPQIDSQFHKS